MTPHRYRAPVSVSLRAAFLRFCAPLLFRPLLWLGLSALLGAALGGVLAMRLCDGNPMSVSRENSAFLWVFGAAFLAFSLVLMFRRNPFWWRVWATFGTICFFAGWSGRALLPPRDDISQIARLDAKQRFRGPLEARVLEVRGLVASWPKRGEFSTQFALQCQSPRAGRIWVRADAQTPVRVGDELVLKLQIAPLSLPTNPGETARFWSLVGAGCWSEGRRIEKWRKLPHTGAQFQLARGVESARAAILRRYETAIRGADSSPETLAARPFPRATAQIMTAMVFGEGGLERPLPRRVREDFRLSGLSHLLVASGTQAALLAGALIWVLGKLMGRPAAVLVWLLPILAFYALVAGGAPSIWRAVLVSELAVLALSVGRRRDGLSLWGAAILFLLILEPTFAWNLSFQLTFAATWGILALAPAILKLWPRKSRGVLAQMTAFCLGAQWATIPVSLFHFGTMSLVGLCANFVAIPIATLLIGFGILGMFLDLAAIFNYAFARLLLDVAHGAAQISGANLAGVGVSTLAVWAFYALFLAAIVPVSADFAPLLRALARKNWRQWGASAGIVALFFGGVSLWRVVAAPSRGTFKIVALDVGQGNATLLISPENRAVLVDGGNNEGRADVGESVILPALRALQIERLEAVIVTAPDAKNSAALSAVVREIPVGFVLDGTGISDEITPRKRARNAKRNAELAELTFPEMSAFLRESARQNVRVVPARANTELQLDGVTIRALSAPQTAPNARARFGFVAQFGANRALILGALDANSQNEIARRRQSFSALRCDLILPGSGEENALTREFLAATKPRAALLSAGRFNFDKAPHPTTLRRLDETKTMIFRTDFDGALTAICDGKECFVQPTIQLGSRE
mgnify:CR=1 FL=1